MVGLMLVTAGKLPLMDGKLLLMVGNRDGLAPGKRVTILLIPPTLAKVPKIE